MNNSAFDTKISAFQILRNASTGRLLRN